MGTPTVEIVEVSPRDGLQNESVAVSTADKVRLIDSAVGLGLNRIEVASFVHPSKVPQMADAEAVLAALTRPEGVSYIGLALNDRGLERAMAACVDEVNIVVVATDTFSLRNQGLTVAEMVRQAQAMVDVAYRKRIPVTLTIAASFGCPFEGNVTTDQVRRILVSLLGPGIQEVALADTIGVGVPVQVAALAELARREAPGLGLRFHFHNTRNTGYANAIAAIDHGATALDASLGGLGGCPFAPGAAGNIATEDLAYLLARSNISSGLDVDAAIDAGRLAANLVGHPPWSMLSRAGGFPGKRGSAEVLPS